MNFINLTSFLIVIGSVLTGALIGAAIAYPFGQRQMLKMRERETDETLASDHICSRYEIEN